MGDIDQYVAAVERELQTPRPSSAPRYEWIGPPAAQIGLLQRCQDCGALVRLDDQEHHDRFHAILNDHARALAVLVNSHISETAHGKYDVRERLGEQHDND